MEEHRRITGGAEPSVAGEGGDSERWTREQLAKGGGQHLTTPHSKPTPLLLLPEASTHARADADTHTGTQAHVHVAELFTLTRWKDSQQQDQLSARGVGGEQRPSVFNSLRFNGWMDDGGRSFSGQGILLCAGLTADQNNFTSFLFKGVQEAEGLNPLCSKHNTPENNLNSESQRLRAVCADVTTIPIRSEP